MISTNFFLGILLVMVTIAFFFNRLVLWVRVPADHLGVLKNVGFNFKLNQDFPEIAFKENELGIIPEVYYPNQRVFKPWRWNYEFMIYPIPIVPEGEIGLVIAKHGGTKSLEKKLGITVDCENFRNSRSFLLNGGKNGPQSRFIVDGGHYINPEIFRVITSNDSDLEKFNLKKEDFKPIQINKNQIGIVTTMDGRPLEGQIAGAKIDGHNKFSDATSFLNNGGYKGLQVEIISGNSFINPWFAKVDKRELIEIPNDRVGVLISSYGKELSTEKEVNEILSRNKKSVNYEQIKDLLKEGNVRLNDDKLKALVEDSYSQKDYEKLKSLLVDSGYKGVMKKTLGTGKHPLNTDIFSVELVPTNQIILEWHNREKTKTNYDYGLKSIHVFTKDRHKLLLEVTQTIRIDKEDAPIMTLTVGSQGDEINDSKSNSIKNLVTKVLSSVIHNEFVAAAAAHNGVAFIDEVRSEIQTAVSSKVSAGLKFHGVVGISTTFTVVELSEELQEQMDEKKKFANQRFQIEETERLEQEKIESKKRLALKELKENQTIEILKLQKQGEIEELRLIQKHELEKQDAEKQKELEKVVNEVDMQKLENELARKLLKSEKGVEIMEQITNQKKIESEQELDIYIKKLQAEGGPEAKILMKLAKSYHKKRDVPQVYIGGNSDTNKNLFQDPSFPLIWKLMEKLGDTSALSGILEEQVKEIKNRNLESGE